MSCPSRSSEIRRWRGWVGGWLVGWLAGAASGGTGTWVLEFPAAPGTTAERVCGFAIEGGRVVSVVLPGQQAAAPRLVDGGRRLGLWGHDPVSRLAVLDGKGLATGVGVLRLGASSGLKPGAVVRIPGVGEGRVAGWVRRFAGRVLPVSLLQVNYAGAAPPAGTPLLGGDGRVVAVGYQADGQRGHAGFALPVEACRRVLADLERDGRVVRTWLGLTLRQGVTPPAVVRVDGESPAARGGLRPGDVLLQVGAYPVSDYPEAVNAFFFLVAGQTVTLRVLRELEVLELQLVPQALPGGAARDG